VTAADLTGLIGAAAGPGTVRPTTPADAVAGVEARCVARPSTEDSLSAVLSCASEHGLRVLVRGEGTKLDWGRPPRAMDLIVDMSGLAGVHAHYREDMVATVAAGTRVSALQEQLARSGQRVAMDPGSPEATVGGLLASGEAGPLRLRHGAPRDQLLGTRFVRSDGTVAHSGGRVVKNVAGYDIGKLLAGSWGTLAVIAAATLRLQPLPARRVWITRTVTTPLEVHELVEAVLASGVDPAAIEVDMPVAREWSLSILLEGSITGTARRVAEVRATVGGEPAVTEAAPDWWGRYPFVEGEVGLKLAVPVADLHAVVYGLRDAAGGPVAVRGSAGTGVCYATVPAHRAAAALEAVRTTLIARGGSCVVLTAPAGVRDGLDMWGPVGGLDLMHSVKARFDPAGIFAAGRYVGGI